MYVLHLTDDEVTELEGSAYDDRAAANEINEEAAYWLAQYLEG